jgi:hypothetical protein
MEMGSARSAPRLADPLAAGIVTVPAVHVEQPPRPLQHATPRSESGWKLTTQDAVAASHLMEQPSVTTDNIFNPATVVCRI